MSEPPEREAAPGASSSDSDATRLIACRLLVPLPKESWVFAFSAAHPELEMLILDRLELSTDMALTAIRLQGPRAEEAAEEIRRHPTVLRLETLGATVDTAEFRVAHRGLGFLPLLRRLKLLRQFPFPIHAGIATWIVVAPEAKVRRILESLRRRAPGVVVESIWPGQGPPPAVLLTPRQQQIFRCAVSEGYFETPRRISLTALAAQLSISKSTLSEALSIVEKKLLDRLPAGSVVTDFGDER